MNARQGPSCYREKTLLCSLHPQVSSVSVNWRCMHSWRLPTYITASGQNADRKHWRINVVDLAVILTSSISPSYADCPLPLLAPSSPSLSCRRRWENPLAEQLPSIAASSARGSVSLCSAPNIWFLCGPTYSSFLPSAFLLLSILTFSVVETLKGPFVRSRKLVPLPPPPPPKLPSCCLPFVPHCSPFRKGRQSTERQTVRPCPSLLPFSPFVRDLSFWAPLFDSQHRSR